MPAQTAQNRRCSAAARSGWLLPRRLRVPSPNCDQRPDPRDVSLLVIHNISLPPDVFGGPQVQQLFTNRLNPAEHPYFETIKDLRVSAHFFINRRGQALQFVSLRSRAWHAGKSVWDGRERCNDFSIGIELEGSDTLPFTAAQYRQLLRLTRLIRARYPSITPDRIVGHSDIAPVRKTDPGPHFNWPRYRRELRRP